MQLAYSICMPHCIWLGNMRILDPISGHAFQLSINIWSLDMTILISNPNYGFYAP